MTNVALAHELGVTERTVYKWRQKGWTVEQMRDHVTRPTVTVATTYERSVFLSDIHVPYHDPTCLAIVRNFLRWFHPQYVWLVGDITDCLQLSKFDKDPNRLLKIQEDLDETVQVLRKLYNACPSAQWHYLEGNHERRLTRYLWQHPELAGLTALTIPRLLQLDDLNIIFHPQHE